MGDETRVVRVTNQDELDAALEADPRDDTVIEIHSDPGKYTHHVLAVVDSRGHAIEARGESRVIVSGGAQLTARGRSMVEAQDAACVHATDFAQVNWRDSSSGKCGYYARGQVWDTATVDTHALCPLFAFDNAVVTARATSHVVAQGEASVTAYNQSVVEMSGDVDVTARGQAVVYCEGGEVYAHEHATVYVMKNADRPSVDGVPTVVVHDLKGDTPVMGGPVVLTV